MRKPAMSGLVAQIIARYAEPSEEEQMDGVNAILSLPLETLVQLATGYICYRTAFIGRNAHHTATDTIFIVVVFAALTKLITSLLASEIAPSGGLLIGSWCAYVTALAWRKHLAHRYAKALRDADYIDHDGQPSAWRTMLAERLKGPTRLVVYLKDGRRLMTTRLSDFEHLKTGCCILGEDGSVGMYVTDTYDPQTKEWVETPPFDPEYADWGYELTIIPAAEVARVEIARPA